MTTIAQERALRASVGLILRTREQAGLRFNYETSRPVIEPAVADFNHISVTNPRNYASNDAHWRAIESIGIGRFGATGISYNGGVLPGGALYEGQPWGRRGAHTVNTYERANCATPGCPSRDSSIWAPSWNNNVNGRALVFARNVNDVVTDADVDAAGRYWAGHKLCGLLASGARLHGHRCCSSKDCPSSRVWARMGDIADLTADYVRTGLPGTQPPPTPKRKDPDMSLLLTGGSSRRRLILGDRIFWVSQADYDLIAAVGVPGTGVSNELIDLLDKSLVAEIEPPAEEPTPIP